MLTGNLKHSRQGEKMGVRGNDEARAIDRHGRFLLGHSPDGFGCHVFCSRREVSDARPGICRDPILTDCTIKL